MAKTFLLFVATMFISIVSSAPSDEQCQSLLQVSSECTPHGNCTGLTCMNTIISVTTSFTVEKCRDPVLVNVIVTYNSNTYHLTFNQSTTGTIGSYTFNWIMSRNDSDVQVEGTITGTPYVVIPSTVVPLNTSDCMCQSIQNIAESSDIPDGAVCVNNSQCTGVDCTISIGGTIYNIKTNIQPCSYPPGFFLIISQTQTGFVVFKEFFNSSTNSSLLLGFPLYVVVTNKPYSMIISVDLLYLNGTVIHLIPQSQIILDKSICIAVTSVPTLATSTIIHFNTSFPILTTTFVSSTPHSPALSDAIFTTSTPVLGGTPFVTPTPVPISSETCTKLKQIAANPVVGTCTTNTRCDTIICSLPGYTTTSEFQILPCYNPPALYIVLKDQNQNILFRRIVTNSSIVQLPSGTLNVTLKHKHNSLGVAIGVISPLKTNILPYTEIPLDHCLCSQVSCPSLLSTTTIIERNTTLAPVYTSPFITPTPVPISSETCNKLRQIAANPMVGTCTTNTRCDTVICSLPGYTSEFQILPCYYPPAFYIVLKDQNKSILFRKIVTNSSIIQTPIGTLNVTLKHKHNSLGVEIGIISPLKTNILPYTEIPLDRCLCSQVSCPSNSSKATPIETIKSGSPLTTTIAITVPVVLAVIVVIVIISVVILVLVLKKRLNYSQEKDLNVQPNKVDVDINVSNNIYADNKENIVL